MVTLLALYRGIRQLGQRVTVKEAAPVSGVPSPSVAVTMQIDGAAEWDAEVVRQTLDTLIGGHGDGVNLCASGSTDQQHHGEQCHIGASEPGGRRKTTSLEIEPSAKPGSPEPPGLELVLNRGARTAWV